MNEKISAEITKRINEYIKFDVLLKMKDFQLWKVTNACQEVKQYSNFKDKYWQGKKPLLNIGICKNTVLLKTQQNQGFIEISILIYKIKETICLY